MRKILFLIVMLAALGLRAAETQVDPATFLSAYTDAADGDVLVMSEGVYGGTLTFPDQKTITMKAAEGADVTMGCLFRANDASLTGGGIIVDGVKIRISDSYLINLDKYGDIKTITMINCDISNIGRCFLRTSTEGCSIDEIIFDNCVIHDCGNGGWNFMYPKHAVKKVSATNCTMYNYASGESFFCPNSSCTETILTFIFSNNTVYNWGKSNDRAFAKVESKYNAASTYTFNDNIIYKGGNGCTPYIVHANNGSLVANNNLVIDYGIYNINDKTINDLSLDKLGMSSLSFPDPDNGDFTIVSSSALATASTTGNVIGAPRWLKAVTDAVTLTVNASPSEGGSATPAQVVLNSGEQAVLSATPNYGYRFKEWQDGNGSVISTENPMNLTVDKDMDVTAVFYAVDTYTLTVNKSGDGGRWGKISLSPEPVNGVYEVGTEVVVSIVPNVVTNFLYWDDNSSEPARMVKMDGNKEIEATFDVVPFIVAWDFAESEPRGNRPADYAFATDNTGLLSIYNGDGSSTNWGGSTRNFGRNLNCIRRYTSYNDMNNPRSYVARFNTEGYTNIRIHALAGADNDCVHSVQKVQYSTDGTNYTDLASLNMTKNEWLDFDAVLPDGLGIVYIRWIGDTSSPLLGTPGSTETEGFYLAEVTVYADQNAGNDTDAPILLSSSPANGSTDVSAQGNFVLTFNERVIAGSSNVTLDGEIIEGKFGSKTVTFPYNGLAYGTAYTLVIPEGAITDLSGNSLAETTISFKTMERPQPEPRLYDAVVAKDGTGDFTSIQAAIDAAPSNRIAPYLIFVKNGEYEELILIPASKPYIHLIGQDREKTIIKFWVNNGGQNDIGWEFSTNNPASAAFGRHGVVQVDASDFYSENITYLNSYGVERQAGPMGQAMHSAGDRQTYNNCKFRSFQDTWYTDVKNVSDRHYVNNCYIEGAVDYLYGAGDVYIENTTFYQARSTGSVVLAPSHKAGTKYGYVIDRCILDGPGKDHKLGRAWQNEPMAVFLNTTFKATFHPDGWSEWHIAPKVFAEYNSMDADGNPIDLTNRRTEYTVDGQSEKTHVNATLSAEDAAKYTYENVTSGTDGWNPRKYFEAVDAPANLNIDSNGILNWRASDYAICYVVIDADDNVVGITKETSYDPAAVSRSAVTKGYRVKAVNEYGSLSAPSIVDDYSAIDAVSQSAELTGRIYYNTLGLSSSKPFIGINIVVENYSDGTTRTLKALY